MSAAAESPVIVQRLSRGENHDTAIAVARRYELPDVSACDFVKMLKRNVRDSEAISDSLNRPGERCQYWKWGNGLTLSLPGIMYVNDRRADSICETALEFLMMKSL